MKQCAFSDPPAKTIDGFSSEEFRQLLDLNLIGYFLACKVIRRQG